MDRAALAEALKGESDRVERKLGGGDNRSSDILAAACAIANDLSNSGRPGLILVGVDRDGVPRGADTGDAAQRKLASRLTSTRLLPNPSCAVEAMDLEGVAILVIHVHPQAVPPVVKLDGVAWVRVGTETRRATDADLGRLHERRPVSAQPFDVRPCNGAGVDDLDRLRLAEEHRASIVDDSDPDSYPSFDKWLGQRNVARNVGGDWIPTNAGILVHGLDPQHFFPGAIVEFVRYAGTDFDAPLVSRKTITGNLGDVLTGLWTQLEANLASVPTGRAGIQDSMAPTYPAEALKELARNLIQHRLYEGTNAPGRVSWFEDCIVFNNPGGPFGRASEGRFGDQSDYRNPTITQLLVEQGYVQRLGRGVRRVRLLLERSGSPPLETETDGHTTITVRRSQ